MTDNTDFWIKVLQDFAAVTNAHYALVHNANEMLEKTAAYFKRDNDELRQKLAAAERENADLRNRFMFSVPIPADAQVVTVVTVPPGSESFRKYVQKQLVALRRSDLQEACDIVQARTWNIRDDPDWTRLSYEKYSYLAGMEDALMRLQEAMSEAEE